VSAPRRTFRIWRSVSGYWRWECSHCQPAAFGARSGPQAWLHIVTRSMPRHFEHRRAHHRYVRQGRAW
jgi:hypothetical protein